MRLKLSVAAWIKNFDGATFVPEGADVTPVGDVSADMLEHEFIVPQFTPAHRYSAYKDAESRGFFKPATVIDPTSVVASSTGIAPGSYFNSLVNVGAAGKIGKFAFINRGSSIGHHVELAEFVSIGPGAVLAGEVRVGRGAVIGAGAVILPGIEIGANAVVGAGATVTRTVSPHSLVTGNPARLTKSGIPGYKGLGI